MTQEYIKLDAAILCKRVLRSNSPFQFIALNRTNNVPIDCIIYLYPETPLYLFQLGIILNFIDPKAQKIKEMQIRQISHNEEMRKIGEKPSPLSLEDQEGAYSGIIIDLKKAEEFIKNIKETSLTDKDKVDFAIDNLKKEGKKKEAKLIQTLSLIDSKSIHELESATKSKNVDSLIKSTRKSLKSIGSTLQINSLNKDKHSRSNKGYFRLELKQLK